MPICQFFLQGRCRFGDRCWNEHPRGGGGRSRSPAPPAPQHQGRGGGWGPANQRYTNVIQPSTFTSSTWGGSRNQERGVFGSSDFGSSVSSSRNADFSQNRFSALLNSQNTPDGDKDEEERLLESVVKDMEIWESSGQWIFSSYSPMKGKPNVSGFQDFSPEELHLEYYTCRANSNIQNYIDSIHQLVAQWKSRLLQLKVLKSSTKAALLSELKNMVMQPVSSFGFGGQVTSGFGLSAFPGNSSSSSVSSFSFQTSPSLVRASSGSSPAFGSSAAVTASASASQSAGFGSPTAPSAASFSFRTAEPTAAFGAPGCSGFGNSSAVSSSSPVPPTDFGAFKAAAAASPSCSSSSLSGKRASASGRSMSPGSSAGTNSMTSEELFTPKSELSAEELKQFEAKNFTLGKIPLQPPPLELLHI